MAGNAYGHHQRGLHTFTAPELNIQGDRSQRWVQRRVDVPIQPNNHHSLESDLGNNKPLLAFTKVQPVQMFSPWSTVDHHKTLSSQSNNVLVWVLDECEERQDSSDLDDGTHGHRFHPPQGMQHQAIEIPIIKVNDGHLQPNNGLPNDCGHQPVNEKACTTLHKVLDEGALMSEHESYHEAISSVEAQRRLSRCGSHCYLTRYSESNKKYTLSVYQKSPYQMKHFEIEFGVKHGGQGQYYKIAGKTQDFNDLEALLVHYEHNRIDPGLRTIGERISYNNRRRWCLLL